MFAGEPRRLREVGGSGGGGGEAPPTAPGGLSRLGQDRKGGTRIGGLKGPLVRLLLLEGGARVILTPLPLALLKSPSVLLVLSPATAKLPNSHVWFVYEPRRHGWKLCVLDVLEGGVPSSLETLLGAGRAQRKRMREWCVGLRRVRDFFMPNREVRVLL